MITEHEIQYGDEIIHFTLCHRPESHQKTKVAIHVNPNGDVQVDAPYRASVGEVKQAVQKRARWVLKHRNEAIARGQFVFPRHYVSGESLLYLGRRYVLKLIQSECSDAKLQGGQFRVFTSSFNKTDTKKLIYGWYRKQALIVFQRRLQVIVEKAPWIHTQPTFKLHIMKKQWGSCSPQGTFSLNPHLVKAPTRCIDYVLLHELCHLKEHNHSPQFYRLLSHQMPDWETVKGKLDGMAELILNE